MEIRPMKANIVEQQLTENIIKKVALRFLRQYYKFRLRYEDQPVTASYDLEGVGGIIADGYYSFKKMDGRLFTATFEATGQDSRDEVVYKPQMNLLFWDGIAIASLVTLALVAVNYFMDLHLLDERTLLVRVLMLLGAMALSFLAFFFIAKNFRRYRYIYAVEQFKRYHADEQWIALADDVFSGPADKYYRELKYQAMINGIGIVQVNQNLDTKILVTPSRQDIFQGKRKQVDLMPKKSAQQQKDVQRFDAKWALIHSWTPSFMKNGSSLLRFRRSYKTQLAVLIGSFLLIGFLFFKEWSLASFQTVDTDEFRNEIAKSQSDQVAEQTEVLGDSLLADDHTNPDIEEFNNSIWEATKRTKNQAPRRSKPPPSNQPASKPRPRPVDTTEIVVNLDKQNAQAYDCARYYTFDTYKYVVVEGNYKNWRAADRRLALIRNNDISSAALAKQCFFYGESGFLIYLGEIFNSPEEASQFIETLNQSPQTVVRNVQQLEIKRLRPPAGR